jgi:hypothetical protein
LILHRVKVKFAVFFKAGRVDLNVYLPVIFSPTVENALSLVTCVTVRHQLVANHQATVRGCIFARVIEPIDAENSSS